ncbi:DUF4097 family beta strand repeat-containing protein [Geodermatophilus sp. CPCC 205506]|uniref:DUF4097 family beta strand repeat-containing protein n=1 Tax=Geodermatophilus sp. CPCC 205506 TaxID=2936596 RepID=UPI003EEE1DAE
MTTIDRPSTRRRRFVGLVILAVVVLWLVGQFIPTTTQSRSFSMGAGTSLLHVEVGTGSVVLTRAEDEVLRVHRTVRHGWRAPEIDEHTSGSRAVIEAGCPGFLGGRCELDYEIAVPDGHVVELSTSSGHLEVRGLRTQLLRTSVSSGRTTLVDVTGPIEFRSSSGSVSATELSSRSVVAEVSSGSTNLEFAVAPTDVMVEASSGDVTLQLPEDGNPYQVRAQSSSGQVQVDLPVDPGSPRSITVTVSSGDVDVLPVDD